MNNPTIRDHAIYRRIKRKMIALSRCDMSPSVEQSLVDIEFAVWFLELAISEDNYVRERLSEPTGNLGGVPSGVCCVVGGVAGANDAPIEFDDDSCFGGS